MPDSFHVTTNMAPVDDMMEVSTEVMRDYPLTDDIEIDIDSTGNDFLGNEDENMDEGEGSLLLEDDDEMADDIVVSEEAIIEDILQYDGGQGHLTSTYDEELQDAEVFERQGNLDHSESDFLHEKTKNVNVDAEDPVKNFGAIAADTAASSDTSGHVRIGQTEAHRNGIEEPSATDSIQFVSAYRPEKAITDDQDPATQNLKIEKHELNIEENLEQEKSFSQAARETEAETVRTGSIEGEKEIEATQSIDHNSRVSSELSYSDSTVQHDSEVHRGEKLDVHSSEGHGNDTIIESVNDDKDARKEAEIKQQPKGNEDDAKKKDKVKEYDEDEIDNRKEELAELKEEEEEEEGEEKEDEEDEEEEKEGEGMREEEELIQCEAVISFQETNMSLFPPFHGDDDEGTHTYLLEDPSLAKETLQTMLGSCKYVLEDNENEELRLSIPSLGLSYMENHPSSKEITIADLVDLYIQLQRNDGVNEPEPLQLILQAETKMPKRLEFLYEVLHRGDGLSAVSKDFHGSDEKPSQDGLHSEGIEYPSENVLSGHRHNTEPGPETPDDSWLNTTAGDGDEFDFRSPHQAQKDSSGGDHRPAFSNEPSTKFDEIVPNSNNNFENQEFEADHSDEPLGLVQGANFDFYESYDGELPSETNQDSEQLNDNYAQLNASLDAQIETNDDAEPPLPLEEDDLHDFDEFLEPNTNDASGDGYIVAKDSTSSATLTGDLKEHDQTANHFEEDEITYEGEDPNVNRNLLEPTPANSTNATPRSLKRQRPSLELGEDDFPELTDEPESDYKRVRGSNELQT